MSNYIVIYFSTLMEYIVFFLLSLALINKKNNIFSKRLITLLISPLIVSLLTPIVTKHFLYSIITGFLEAFTLIFCLKIKAMDFIEIFAADYILVVVFIQVPITIGLSLLNITDEVAVYIIGSVLTLLFGILFYFKLPLSKLYLTITKQKYTRLIICNIGLIAIIITIYFKAENTSFYDNILLIVVTMFLLIFANMEILITRTHITNQRKQLEAYNSYMPIIEQLITEVRHRQHNHDNDIQAIQMMPTMYKTYEELSAAIINYSHHMVTSNMPSNLLKLNTKLIAGFIFSKCNLAKSQNKSLSVKLNSFELYSSMPEYEIITVIGILIDNAIEATPIDCELMLHIDCQNNKMIFKTFNLGPIATPQFIEKIFSEGYTSKTIIDGSPHGLGLPTLLKLIKNYNGEITVENEIINNKNYICFELEI